MPAVQIAGMGWLPDIPDQRDRTMAGALRPSSRDKKGPTVGEQPVQVAPSAEGEPPPITAKPDYTLKGWEVTSERSAEVGRFLTSDRDPRRRERYGRALRRAFGDAARDRLLLKSPPTAPPPAVDLRPFMSPVENQQSLGSCTAHAVIGLVEYLQIATHGQYLDASRLFLYKTTRDLLEWVGDTGAFIRETIKAMALFGVCPEKYLPYRIAGFDDEPSSFCYSFAGNYKAVSYYRLEHINQIRASLAQGYPVAFGFACYESIDDPAVGRTGVIPYPVEGERTVGGHAVLAVGYIDQPDWYAGEGLLIIRNSWGTDWGQDGYGFMPYSYIQQDGPAARPPASDDYWTMTQLEYADLVEGQAPPFAMGVDPPLRGTVDGPPMFRRRAGARPVPRDEARIVFAAKTGAGRRGGGPLGDPVQDGDGGNPVFLAGPGVGSRYPDVDAAIDGTPELTDPRLAEVLRRLGGVAPADDARRAGVRSPKRSKRRTN